MAKAGARYEVETGNIWGYAHRVRSRPPDGQQPASLIVLALPAIHARQAEPMIVCKRRLSKADTMAWYVRLLCRVTSLASRLRCNVA
eukprot:COSAG02_NODE_1026_length_15134_cov_382.979714_15_plen_87_part_00